MSNTEQHPASRSLAWAFVAPALLLLLAMNLFPLLFNVYLSFTNADLSGGAVQTVGARNYTVLFSQAKYANALTTTALFVLLSVSIELVLGFVLALALRDRVPGKPVVLTVLLVPMMLCPVVLSLFWNLILNGHYGVLNQLLSALHLPQPQWLTDDDLKLVSILLVDVWMWTPFMMLISLAGLNAIPKHIYEAAEIDRAGRFMVFRTITLPMCAPLLGLAVLLRATDALKQFDLVMAITGPNDATTQTLSARIYQVVFRDYKVGLGSAYGVRHPGRGDRGGDHLRALHRLAQPAHREGAGLGHEAGARARDRSVPRARHVATRLAGAHVVQELRGHDHRARQVRALDRGGRRARDGSVKFAATLRRLPQPLEARGGNAPRFLPLPREQRRHRRPVDARGRLSGDALRLRLFAVSGSRARRTGCSSFCRRGSCRPSRSWCRS